MMYLPFIVKYIEIVINTVKSHKSLNTTNILNMSLIRKMLECLKSLLN